MKKVVFLMLAIFAMCSCEENHCVDKQEQYVNGKDYVIVRIDKCQYIKYHTWNGSSSSIALIHKGNCDNTIHVK